MVLIRPGGPDMVRGIAGIMSDKLRRRWDSDSLLWRLSPAIEEALTQAGIQKLVYGWDGTGWSWEESNTNAFAWNYEAKDLPMVLFLAPDGEELTRLLHPSTEEELLAGIEEAAAAFARRDEAVEEDGDE